MMPPLGLRYISAMLKNSGFTDVTGIDLNVDKISKFESEVMTADVLGIYAVSRKFPEVVEFAEKAKGLNSRIKVVIGGPHASLEPEEVISCEYIDFVVMGEGEYTFLELVRALEKDEDLSQIKGICYKLDGNTKRNSAREWIKNLDNILFPDFELFNSNKYSLKYYRLPWSFIRTATAIASRGCPYNCTTCQPALREINGPYRQRSVKNVLLEIKFLKQKYKVRYITFLDNTFTVNRNWVVDFCNELIKQKIKIKWDCAGTVSLVDKDLLLLMKKAGCRGISFGIESGSQYVLDKILNKRQTVHRAREVIQEAGEAKLRTHCWFMIGIPGETKEQMLETVELAKNINCTSLMFSIVQPQPHVAITRICIENGWLKEYSLFNLERRGLFSFTLFKDDEYLGRSSLFKTEEWGAEFIEEVKLKIVKDFQKLGWERDGFTFINPREEAKFNFIIYVGKKLVLFLTSFNLTYIKWIFITLKHKINIFYKGLIK